MEHKENIAYVWGLVSGVLGTSILALVLYAMSK
ncbi:MAG: hypothetical protein K0S61_4912 [Anaerocolumna sp.]|jgi:hypothetical protein|nr:hypothetical protein [Anaerocolumna sp.]